MWLHSAQQPDQSKLQGVSGEGSDRQGAQLRLCTLLKHCLVQSLFIPLCFQSFFPGKIVCLQCGGAELSAFRASVNPYLNPGLTHKHLHT